MLSRTSQLAAVPGSSGNTPALAEAALAFWWVRIFSIKD